MSIDLNKFNLEENDKEALCSPDKRSTINHNEYCYKCRNEIIKRIEEIDVNTVSEKDLLKLNALFMAKIYWEMRKPKDK